MKILKGNYHGDVCYVLVKTSQILIKVPLLKHEIALRAPGRKHQMISRTEGRTNRSKFLAIFPDTGKQLE